MNTPEPSWDLYRTFLEVLREGSLSGAARALNLTQPTISRHIDALEDAVGFALFVRSQRGLAATDAALELQPYAEALAATAAAMLRTASGQGGAVRGTVRLTASEVVGAEILPPILAALRERHEELEIELVLSNAVANLLRRDADIAVRMVEPVQEALVVKRAGHVSVGLHAHRRYLERCGTPERLEDLAGHGMIGYDRATPIIRAMRARVPGVEHMRFSVRTDSDLAQLAAIKAGVGIGFCQAQLAARVPELRRVLADAVELKLGLWIVMHEDLRSTPRCRAVFDALVAGLSAAALTASPA